jgi:hypothetical protein
MAGLQELTLHFPEPVNRIRREMDDVRFATKGLCCVIRVRDKDVLSVDFQGLLFLEGRIQYEGK